MRKRLFEKENHESCDRRRQARCTLGPAYGLLVVPLVFLARLNGLAAIVFVFLLAVLSIGGESAARRLGVPHYVHLVIVAVLLVASALAERLDRRRARHV